MNVLVFCVDTLRKDHLPTYGYHRETAPAVAEFAAEATRFERAITPSTFTFSVASSMLSGLYPSTHGALSFDDRLGEAVPYVPELLGEAGYRTGVFSGMNYFTDDWGLARGFQENYAPDGQTEASAAESLVDEFLDWLDAGDGPFFSVLWSFDVHKPYVTVADEFEGADNSAVDPYDNAIRYTDRAFGRLLEALRRRDLYDDTVVVFLADHGEVFGEHHWMESSRLARLAVRLGLPVLADLLREDQLGHVAIPPYEEVIDVPLFVRVPGEGGGSRDDLVQTLDLAPTVLDLAGVETPAEMQGRSFAPGGETDARDTAFVKTSQIPGGAAYTAARRDDRKVVRITDPSWENDTLKFYLGRRFFTASEQAFALDGRERRIPVGECERELFAELDRHEADCVALSERFATDAVELSGERRDHLREMGYL